MLRATDTEFRIENHAAAAQLRRGIESWQAGVNAYNAKIRAFVALEPTDFPGLVTGMSAELKESSRTALVEVAKAGLALLGPRVEAARTLMNDAGDGRGNRRFAAPGVSFAEQTQAWRTRRFQQAEGDRAAVVPDSEYDRMTPEQQERIDYLMGTMYMYLPACTEPRHKTEEEHRNTKKRLDRVGG